jgi:hypothetical protein
VQLHRAADAVVNTGSELTLRTWFAEAEAAAGIARQLADTPFVPESLKRYVRSDRNAPAVLDVDATVAVVSAALLAGQELGFGPMAALRSFDVIRGVPALRANALRALVQHYGHDLTTVESNGTRAVVRGRRSNGETQQSTWTLDRARQMGLYPGKEDGQWRRQPQNMLVARATAEAARWIASDAILGMPYIAEELADEPYEIAPPAGELEAAPEPAKRAKRRTAATRVNALTPPPPQPPPPVIAGSVVAGGDDPATAAEPAARPAPVPPPREPAAEEGPPMINRAQLSKLHIKLREARMTDPADALDHISVWVDHVVTTTKSLTAAEASTVLTRLDEFIAAEAEDAGGADDGGDDPHADD